MIEIRPFFIKAGTLVAPPLNLKGPAKWTPPELFVNKDK